jgi:hypothetical protein
VDLVEKEVPEAESSLLLDKGSSPVKQLQIEAYRLWLMKTLLCEDQRKGESYR